MAKKTYTFTSLPSELQAQTFIVAGTPYTRSDLSLRLAQAYPFPIVAAIAANGALLVYRASDISDAELDSLLGDNMTQLAPTTTDKTSEYLVNTLGNLQVSATIPEMEARFVTAVTPKVSATVAASYLDNVAGDAATFIFSQKGNGSVIVTDLTSTEISALGVGTPILSATLTEYTGAVGAANAFGE